MISIGDFQPYLQAILDSLRKEGDLGGRYIPTQAELPLQVQICEFSPEDSDQSQFNEPQLPEQLAVLDGLRKYASEQVLLVGKPGSGKSTALRRLWYEETERCVQEIEYGQKTISPIPVLLNLKEFREGSVTELLQKTIQRYRLRLTLDKLEDFLFEGQLLLLLDGLNELPEQSKWLELDTFRRDHPKLHIVFTTRELGAYANLGIVQKLEMMPLSKSQMQEFVQKRLPETGEKMWQQVRGRVRELAETPLLLQMLCDTFAEKGKIPESRGELFRKEFTRRYKNFKQARNISDESRRFTFDLLCYLASKMVQGLQHNDPCKPSTTWLTISKTEAETILSIFLAGDSLPNFEHKKNSKEWLEDLLEWDLLQVANEDEYIEFHHQLFQEYYAAEWLSLKLVDLSDEALKYYYLNYWKWTEPLAMVIAFLQSRDQAEHLIKLALDVDLSLEARLAGEVQSQFHTTVVESISRLEVPEYLKVELLGKMRSNATIPKLLKAFKDKDSKIAGRASGALVNLGSDQSVLGLLEALKDKDSEVRIRAVNALGYLGSKQAISDLSLTLEKALEDSDSEVRGRAVMALEKLSSKKSIPALIEALRDPDSEVRGRAANALGNLGATEAISALQEIRQDTIPVVRMRVAEALRKLESDPLNPSLVTTLERKKRKSVRGDASDVLEKLRIEKAIPFILEDSKFTERVHIAKSLKQKSTIDVIRYWVKLALRDEDYTVRMDAANALSEINTIDVIRIWSELADLVHTSLGDAAFKVMSSVQFDCKFYNYDIAQSLPPKLSNEHPNKQGMTSMTTYNFDQRGAYIGVNVANEGSIINFVQYANQNIDFSKQDLAEAARKIEALLTQLGQTYPVTTEAQQQTFIQKFLERIESTPDLIKVFLAGGIEGLKILCPPAGIPIEIARSIYEAIQKRYGQP
jgi:HEAT repeat protein